ncbi:MAG: hypothetical protein WC704_16865 [Sphingomonas sp.]|jgi:hypothetical protein
MNVYDRAAVRILEEETIFLCVELPAVFNTPCNTPYAHAASPEGRAERLTALALASALFDAGDL